MSTDSMMIGSAPSDEDVAQVGATEYDYSSQARKECKAFIGQLRRMFGLEPEGATLVVKGNPHDFGTYYTVDVKNDIRNEAAVAYAFKLEAEGPAEWDDEARKELKL